MVGNNFKYSERINIVAGDHYLIDFKEKKETDNHAPFKNMVAHNKGIVDVEIWLNSDCGFELLQASTIGKVENEEISRVLIKNTSETQNAEVILTLNNNVTELECLKKLARLDR